MTVNRSNDPPVAVDDTFEVSNKRTERSDVMANVEDQTKAFLKFDSNSGDQRY